MGRPKFDFHTGRFGIVGVDRQTGSAFPFGVEAIILKASVASETCSVELKGPADSRLTLWTKMTELYNRASHARARIR